MVGKYQLKIDGTQLVQGLATSDYTSDGAIGTTSSGIDLLAVPGTVRATPVTSMTGSIPASETIIAACEDGTGVYNRIVVTDGGSWSLVGNTTFNTFARQAPFSNFVAGKTDLVWFAGYAWATRTTDIAKFDVNAGTPIIDTQWWTVTKTQTQLTGSTRHPLLVYEGFLWIADGNKLHNTDGTTPFASVLTLNTTDKITALGIDPGSGLMMISVRTLYDSNDQLSAANFIYLYDGFSPKPRRKISVDSVVWSFKSVGGYVYVGAGNYIGVWNGNGVTFLRRLTNTSSDGSAVPDKARLAHFQNTLLAVDNNNTILAYGDVMNGKKVWYPLYKTAAGAKNIALITNLGNDTTTTIAQSPFILATGGSQVATVVRPIDLVNVGSGVLYTNNVTFERPIYVRSVRVITTGITTTTGIGGCAIVDETGTVRTPTVSTFVVAAAASPRYMFDFNFGGLKLQAMSAKITLDTQAFGIIGLIVYYDVAE